MLELVVEEMKTCSNGTRFLDNTQVHVVRTGIEMDKMSKTELFGQAGMKNRKILHLAQKMRRKYPGNEIVLLGQNCWRCSAALGLLTNEKHNSICSKLMTLESDVEEMGK